MGSIEHLEEHEATYRKKVKELEKMEEQFNQCVSIIPESDEGAIKLTGEINKLKDDLEKANRELVKHRDELFSVQRSRSEKFMGFFKRVQETLPNIYKDLTRLEGAVGQASLLITDNEDLPFESQIIFDFCPPGKRHGADLEQLSGGEKTIAALSFVFALATVKQPPMMIMDEIDAFLDSDNVNLVTNYLKASLDRTQTLIISHKEELASKTESLLGVCMLKDHQTSKAYSMDLKEFA